MEEAEIAAKLQKEKTKKLVKLEMRLVKAKEDTQKGLPAQLSMRQHDQYPSLKAYVTFDSPLDRAYVLQKYDKFWSWNFIRIFCNCCWDIEKIMPAQFKLNGIHTIKVKKTDAPSNIIWENLEITKGSRRFRKIVFNFLIILALIFTSSLVIAGSYYDNIQIKEAEA